MEKFYCIESKHLLKSKNLTYVPTSNKSKAREFLNSYVPGHLSSFNSNNFADIKVGLFNPKLLAHLESSKYNVPSYVILRKVNDEFYEVFTNQRIVPETKYFEGEGIFYRTFTYGDDLDLYERNYIYELPDKSPIFDDWNKNIKKNISKLSEFIEDAKVNFLPIRKLYFDLLEQYQKEEEQKTKRMIKQFNDNLNKYGKK